VIDMHCHLLPGVDDGPVDWEESIRLVRQGAADGIKAVLVTPHLAELDLEQVEIIRRRFSELVKRVNEEGIRMKLILGAEVMFQFGLEKLRELGVGVFGKRYFLLELVPFGFVPPRLEDILFRLHLEGLHPILAHIERYPGLIGNPERLERLARMGVFFQVNAGTFLGGSGSSAARTVLRLARMGLVHVVGSDAHNAISRPMRMSEARIVVERNVGMEVARRIFEEIPEALLAGERVNASPPMVEEEGILKKMARRFLR